MRLPESFTTVTPLSKGIAAFLFILFPSVGFYLGMQYQAGLSPIIPPITSISNIPQKINKQVNNEQIYYKESQLVKAYGKIFSIDNVYGYRLDLTNIPEVTFTDPDLGLKFVFDMYKVIIPSNIAPKYPPEKAARFGVSSPYDNPENLSLIEFAKKKLDYIEGKGMYGVTTNSKVRQVDINGKYKGIGWDSTSTLEGPSNTRQYLLNVNGKYILFEMYSWTSVGFSKAAVDFDRIVASFYVETKTN